MNGPRDIQQWLQSEDVILERGYRSGLDVVELAKRHLRSEAVIVERLHELGWINKLDVDRPDSDIDEQFPNIVEQDLDQDFEHGRDDEDWESDEEFLDRIRGCPKDSAEPDLIRGDWGDIQDDLESSDWEGYLGGPEDED